MNKYKAFWEKNLVSSGTIEKKAGIKTGSREYFDYYDSNLRLFDDWAVNSDWYGFQSASNRKVLDIGCGNGWVSYRYAANGAKVVVTDISESAIRLSKNRFVNGSPQGNLHFLSCDAQSLPFKDNSFDSVACISVIHNVPDYKKAISEIVRVSKKNGVVYLMVFHKNSFFFRIIVPILALMRKKSRQEILNSYDGFDNPLTNAFSKEELLVLLRGLDVKIYDFHLCHLPPEHFPLFKFRIFSRLEVFLEKRIGFYLFIKGKKVEKNKT